MKHILFLVGITSFLFLSACSPTQPAEPLGELGITKILSSSEPIIPGEALPEFKTHFSTGTTAIYSYVFLENTQTMTGSFPVRMRWFSPNDFRPPMAQHIVELEPGQEIAQFEIHNEGGMMPGPYMLLARTGRDQSNLTASGTSRFFVNMTDEEATTFLEDEAEYRRKRDEKRAKREEEEAARKAEEEKNGTGGLLDNDPFGPMNLEGEGEEKSEKDEEGTPASVPVGAMAGGEDEEDDEEQLPPALTGVDDEEENSNEEE